MPLPAERLTAELRTDLFIFIDWPKKPLACLKASDGAVSEEPVCEAAALTVGDGMMKGSEAEAVGAALASKEMEEETAGSAETDPDSTGRDEDVGSWVMVTVTVVVSAAGAMTEEEARELEKTTGMTLGAAANELTEDAAIVPETNP